MATPKPFSKNHFFTNKKQASLFQVGTHYMKNAGPQMS